MPAPPHSASAVLTINLEALAANWQSLADRAPSAICAAVVKADAYGIGVGQAAPVLASAGCDTFFVATTEEGMELRGILGPSPRILAFNGPLAATTPELVANSIIPVVNDLGQIEIWSNTARKAGVSLAAALHIDTGMNRLGLPPEEVELLSREPERLTGVDVELVMSHFACAEEHSHPKNKEQILRFQRLKGALEAAPASLAASSGIYLGDHAHFELVRPGAAIYGVNPTPTKPNPMSEVVHLQGKILQTRQIDSPQSVGYGASFRAVSPRRIATVGLGYADGYMRSLGGCGFGILGGIRVPLVGRVSMDLLTLDVTDVPEDAALPGNWVSLIGNGIQLDDVAAAAGTIGYEILTSLGTRYPRKYLGGPAT